jgi:trimeric autotransporter adhesin
MAINKNFIVKNGFEAGTNLIFADADTREVGIGTTNPEYTLHVIGGIGVTNSFVSGISTVLTELNVGTGGTVLTATDAGSVGIGTTNPEYTLHVIGGIGVTNSFVTGISTVLTELNVGTGGTVLTATDAGSVGIGTTNPEYTLHVIGGIGVTNSFVSGISTVLTELNVGLGGTVLTVLGVGNSIGIGTALPAYLLDIRSPVSTGQTALYVYGDVIITGDLSVDDITFDDATLSNLTVTEALNVPNTGIGTIVTFDSTNGTITNLTGTAGTITTLNSTNGTVTNLTGTAGTITTFDSTNGTITNLTGTAGTITTFDSTNGSITNLTGTNVSYSGISTLGTVKVSSGIITATSGIVTYYGDGSNLTGLAGVAALQSVLNVGNNSTTGINVTGVITATTFVGALTGTATTTTNIPNLTGAITSANTTTSLGSFSSSDLATALTDKTGSGSAVFATSPTLTTPALGTPSSGTLTNCTFPTLNQNTTGSAATLTTGRTIAITGDLAYTSPSFNGSGNVTAAGTLATVNSNVGSFGSGSSIPTITVNAKGLITAVSTTAVTSGTTITDDTTTNASRFLTFTSATSGSISAANVSSTKLTFNPSTGLLTVVDINSTSDLNLKENVQTVENALETVNALRGVSFDWKETGRSSYGVIAQELQEILPDLVTNGDVKSVNYNGIIGVLIEAIKELKKEVEDLKNTK